MAHKKERGSIAAEFVILLPIFLLILFAIVEFGRTMAIKNKLTTAAREGARFGIRGGDIDVLYNKIIDALNQEKITPENVAKTLLLTTSTSGTIEVNLDSEDKYSSWTADNLLDSRGLPLQIILSIPYHAYAFVPEFIPDFTIAGSVTMRREMIN
ncbi:MAG: pilus assembly protein [Candidatus Omnitrophica bacterium]|nr:pilus assembly protein [Candidatus Omnitrophota bacterium]